MDNCNSSAGEARDLSKDFNSNLTGQQQPPALPPRPNNRMFQVLSSDEAPDSGDESDEDLITSYLHGGSNNDSTTTMVAAEEEPPILEDHLSHLTQIRDRIQKMRMENAEAAVSFLDPKAKSSPWLFLPSGHRDRLSTSCPSLNNSLVDPGGGGGSRPPQKPGKGSKDGAKASSRKRHQQGHRRRSVSVSSGDSDADMVDGSASSAVKSWQRSSSSHHHPATARCHTAPIPQQQQQQQQGQRKSERAGPSSSSSGASDSIYQSIFQNRQSSTKCSRPYLSSQFGHVLQKSISTPSIVVENFGAKSGNAAINCPEPTHVFLQQLMSSHDWMRKVRGSGEEDCSVGGGSDSDNLSLPLEAAAAEGCRRHSKKGSELGHQATATAAALPPAAAASSSTGSYGKFISLHDHHPPVAGPITPSPQLSLSEFLQNDSPLLEDDDSRKRRRKKERSSLFFRKKKDKTNGGKSAPFIGPPSLDQQPSSAPSDRGTSSRTNPTLNKVSSSINLGSSSFQSSGGSNPGGGSASLKSSSSVSSSGHCGKFSQHNSYSMSSLRRGSAHSQNPSHPNSTASTFYLARGELNKAHEDREDFGHEGDTVGLIEGEFVPGEEFPEGGPAAVRDLDTSPFLRIEEVETETWQQTVRQEDLRGLRPIDVKHQEHIYEVIITESNHCQVLKVIEKIFVEGMYKYLNLSKDVVDRIFPCIDQMLDIHMSLLEDLRIRQNEQPVVSTISDILYRQFSGENASKWRSAYGAFCSSHNEAIGVFKDLMKSDRRFQQFVRQCSENPLLKKKGVPECILFVTTRITKYPLLIDALIKTAATDRPAEEEELRQASRFVREILKDVNARVAEKERKARLLEIYNRLDAKSTIVHKGRKFKKSELLSSNRKLMFEGTATLTHSKNRSSSAMVVVLVLSDVVVFLQENNQKYFFITPENKPSILPVRSLIAQERTGPGTGSKSLAILSSSRNTSSSSTDRRPERFEIEIHQPPTRDDWMSGIKAAVDACPPGSDGEAVASDDEDLHRSLDAKHLRRKRLTALLKSKDIDMAKILEEKMKVLDELVQAEPLDGVDYVELVRGRKKAEEEVPSKDGLLEAVHEASCWATSLYAQDLNLSRSASSVGERQSQDFATPALPKRADTFNEFDLSSTKKLVVQEINLMSGETDEAEFVTGGAPPPADEEAETPPLLSLDPEQRKTAHQMTHRLNRLMCVVSKHFTAFETLKAELAGIQDKSRLVGGRYARNQQFEELRNQQEALAREKSAWQLERDREEKELDDKRIEQQRMQAELERSSKDVREQREQFFRQLEVLRKNHGIELGPNMAVLKSDPSVGVAPQPDVMFFHSDQVSNADAAEKTSSSSSRSPHTPGGLAVGGGAGVRKTSSMSGGSSSSAAAAAAAGPLLHGNTTVLTGGSLKKENIANLNLMSATNESKQSVVGLDKQEIIKQQIPVKLSSKLSVSTRCGSSASTSALSSVGASSSEKLPRRGNPSSSSSSSAAAAAAAAAMSGSVSGSALSAAKQQESVQQMLPFKLSESGSQQQQQLAAQTSPSKSKLSSSSFGDSSRFSQAPTYPGGAHPLHHQQQQQHYRSEGLHQRTGSQPHLAGAIASAPRPTQPQQQGASKVNSNTLPKKDGKGGDNVIYFF